MAIKGVDWPFNQQLLAIGRFRAEKHGICRLLSEQVALDVHEGPPDLGHRSEGRLCIVCAAVPDTQEAADLAERQLLDPV